MQANFVPHEHLIFLGAGRSRYILSPPHACELLSAARTPGRMGHSLVDWADPATWSSDPFSAALGAQVVLEAGDVLYIPAFWSHAATYLTRTAECGKVIAMAAFPPEMFACLARAREATLPVDSPNDTAAPIPWADLFVAGSVEAGGGGAQDHRGVRVAPPALSEATMAALLPGWRSAPWWSGAADSTVYSDAAAARIALQFGPSPIGWLFQQALYAEEAYAALVTSTPASGVLEEAKSWAPAVNARTLDGMSSALRAIAEPCHENATCPAAAVTARVFLRLPGAPTGCAARPSGNAFVFISASTNKLRTTSLTVQPIGGDTLCLPPASDDTTGWRHTPLDVIPRLGVRRESARYEFRVRDDDRSATAARDVAATVRVFSFPSLSGPLGRLVVVQAMLQGLVDDGLVPPHVLRIATAVIVGLVVIYAVLLTRPSLPRGRRRAR